MSFMGDPLLYYLDFVQDIVTIASNCIKYGPFSLPLEKVQAHWAFCQSQKPIS